MRRERVFDYLWQGACWRGDLPPLGCEATLIRSSRFSRLTACADFTTAAQPNGPRVSAFLNLKQCGATKLDGYFRPSLEDDEVPPPNASICSHKYGNQNISQSHLKRILDIKINYKKLLKITVTFRGSDMKALTLTDLSREC